MIIYKATNTINGKYYIGKTTTTLEKRIRAHKSAANKKKWVFYSAINKYGFDNFKWEVLAECTDIDTLNKLEIKLIEENIGGYNVAKGGSGGDTFTNNPNKEIIRENVSNFHKGKVLTDEHKEKISKGNKGKTKTFTEEHKNNIGKSKKGVESPNKGKTYEEIMGVEKALEFKKRQSEMRKGRVVSEETKKKISEYHKNKKNEK